MYLEDVLSALSGGLQGGLDGYSFVQGQRERERSRIDRKAQLDADAALALDERNYRRGRDRVADERYTQERRIEDARILSSLLQPDQELTPDQFGALDGTPYGVRVNSTLSLPSRTIPELGGAALSDPGGAPVRTWRPTAADMRARAADARARQEEADRRAFFGTLPLVVRRVVEARRNGINVGADDLKSPEELAAEQKAADAHALTLHEGKAKIDARYRPATRGGREDADPSYSRDRQEYQDYVSAHDKGQAAQQRIADRTIANYRPMADPNDKAPEPYRYQAPEPFEAWRQRVKGRGGAPSGRTLPLQPRMQRSSPRLALPSAADAQLPLQLRGAAPASAAPVGSRAPQIDSVVSVRVDGQRQRLRVTKVLPNGQIEGMPVQ